MTKFIDTHAHLQFKSYDEDRGEVGKRNSEELEKIINVGTSIDASYKGIALSKEFDNFYASVAVHPHHIDQWDKQTYEVLKKLTADKKVVAVGETGLDKHLYKGYPQPDLKKQAEILGQQISLSIELKKPVLFHCREAYDELHEQIKKFRGRVSGLMHCYMGNWDQAKKFLDLGLYISFSGNITYKKNDYIREVAKKLPEEKILTETDSPFLSPESHRGKRNEPVYVKIVAGEIAKVRGCSVEEVARFTTQNAKVLFDF